MMALLSRDAALGLAPWSPVLSGIPAAEAQALVDEIVTVLLATLDQTADALVLAELGLLFATVSQRRELAIDFSALLQRIIDAARATVLRPVLTGSLGYGLTLQQTLTLLGSNEDVCSYIDVGLAATMTQLQEERFDLLHGISGRLLYLLERPVTPLNEKSRELLLQQLSAKAQHDARGAFWQGTAGTAIDLGVAHGTAGIISVLAGVVARGWGGSREEALLRSALEWLWSHHATRGAYRFPFVAGGDDGRLAWCYGDLGIATALERSGSALHEPVWHARAEELAQSAAKVTVEQSHVLDASLCHGAAGAGLLFAALARSLPSESLREASSAWFARVRSYRQPDAPLAGFRFRRPNGWFDEPNLLEGAVGIALALETATSESEPAWLRFTLAL